MPQAYVPRIPRFSMPSLVNGGRKPAWRNWLRPLRYGGRHPAGDGERCARGVRERALPAACRDGATHRQPNLTRTVTAVVGIASFDS